MKKEKTAEDVVRGLYEDAMGIPSYYSIAQAVLDWNESRREKVGECWRVEFVDALHDWQNETALRSDAMKQAREGRKYKGMLSCKVFHVTRYRRKRA